MKFINVQNGSKHHNYLLPRYLTKKLIEQSHFKV